jgi:hypothetical protein
LKENTQGKIYAGRPYISGIFTNSRLKPGAIERNMPRARDRFTGSMF